MEMDINSDTKVPVTGQEAKAEWLSSSGGAGGGLGNFSELAD